MATKTKKKDEAPEEAAAKLDPGLDDLEIVQLDGANAVFRLGKEERLVGQADLFRVSKAIARAIQQTY